MNGTDILLLANTGTELVPVYTVVGSQRDVSFDETNATIDESSKDARAWTGDYGRYEAEISLDALYVPDDTAYLAIKDAARDGTKLLIRRSTLAVETEQADCIVTKVSEKAPDQDAAVVSVSLKVDGTWTTVGS